MNPVQLALRVLRGDSRSRMSALFTAVGVAVGAALVLWLAAVPGALQSRADREGWRQGNFAENEADATLLADQTRDNVGAQRIERYDVAALKPNVPLAAGIPKLPGPGEVLLSPALAELAASLPADQLADRFKGKVIGQFGPEALKYPEELVAMVGHDPSELSGGARRTGLKPSGSGYINELLVILSQIGLVVLIAPCLVLVASAARLTAARRERRLAALRLAGATPQQVVSMTATETAIASVIGVALGIAAIFPLRWLTAKIPWDGGTWYPSDWTPSTTMLILVFVLAPVLVVGAAVLGLRRAVNRPLGAAQQQTRRQPNVARLLWVVGAAVGFVLALGVAKSSRDGGMTLVLFGLAAVAVSLVFVGPLVTSLLGKIFVARWRSPSTLLAGRRLRDDPKAAFRASAGVVLAVFAGSLALAMFPSVEDQIGYSTGTYRDGVYVAQGVSLSGQQIGDLRSDLDKRGVDAPVVQITEGSISSGRDNNSTSAMMVTCTDASKVLGAKFDSCRPGPAIYVPQAQAVNTARMRFRPSGFSDVPEDGLPFPAAISVREYQPSGGFYGIIVDPSLFAGIKGADSVAVVTTPQNKEIVHTLLVRNLPGTSLYSNERYDARADTLAGDLRRATLIGLSIATVLGGVSAAVASAGSVVDRRRTFGALIAAGTPVRVLTKALRREAMLPALIATVGAGVAGVLVGSGLLTLVKGELQLNPWILTPIVLGLLVALIAAVACGPVLRKVTAQDYTDE